MDGHEHPGGCDDCDATVRWTTISLGESRIDIIHDVNCPKHGMFPWFGPRQRGWRIPEE